MKTHKKITSAGTREHYVVKHVSLTSSSNVMHVAKQQKHSDVRCYEIELLRNRGCLLFSQKNRKFRLQVKWNSNFPENPFENCGLPPEVVLFCRSE